MTDELREDEQLEFIQPLALVGRLQERLLEARRELAEAQRQIGEAWTAHLEMLFADRTHVEELSTKVIVYKARAGTAQEECDRLRILVNRYHAQHDDVMEAGCAWIGEPMKKCDCDLCREARGVTG